MGQLVSAQSVDYRSKRIVLAQLSKIHTITRGRRKNKVQAAISEGATYDVYETGDASIYVRRL
jgi:hypothetical protein